MSVELMNIKIAGQRRVTVAHLEVVVNLFLASTRSFNQLLQILSTESQVINEAKLKPYNLADDDVAMRPSRAVAGQKTRIPEKVASKKRESSPGLVIDVQEDAPSKVDTLKRQRVDPDK